MAKDKQPNYTEAQTDELVEAYTGAESDAERKEVVDEFATNFGKSVASVRQKLVREGVYQKPEKKKSVTGKVERKAEIVADIAAAMGADESRIESLEKGTKDALNLVRASLLSLVAIANGKAETANQTDSE